MGFNGFVLFGEQSNAYLNTESIGSISGVSSLTDSSSFNIPGLNSGGGFGFSQNSGGGISTGPENRNLGYLVDTITRERVEFQYNVDFGESGGAEYAMQKALARSVPYMHYKNGKERVLDMPITFTINEESREDVKRSIRFLQGLAYPDYEDDEGSLAPHPVIVVQGELYTEDIWVVQDYSIKWGEARDPESMLPHEATITLKLIEISDKGKSYDEVIHL